VTIPVTVAGFNNIGACSLCFDYTFAGLHFVSGAPNSSLPGFAIGDQDLGNGKHRVTMGWFGTGVTLPDGSAIMTMTFTYISGMTALEFYDNGPSCEYADANYNVLPDQPAGTYYINGYVCGILANPGTISGNTSVCTGQAGIDYSIAPVPNATGYNWTVPAGVTIMNGNGTTAISADFSLSAISGNISVYGENVCGNGPASQLPVTVNVLPVASAGTDKSIPYGTSTTLNAASGGTGTFAYHWSPEASVVNPNLQNAQTVNLAATTVFTLRVQNLATLCEDSDEIVVTITGGPLNVNPVPIPAAICSGTSSQLFANAGGGSGNYSYTWTCTPPGAPVWTSPLANPVVSPTVTTQYHLDLSDGFNTTSGNTQVTVYALPSATISGGDTLCGTGNSTVLTVDLTGTPPWSFYYSNQVITWYIQGQITTPYLIYASEPGTYTVLAMADMNCNGTASGSAVVGVFPIPPTPVISVNGQELSSSGCCGNQWYKEGIPIAGATSQTYTPHESAHYDDIVTIDGCSSGPSNTLYFLMPGIRDHSPGDAFFLEPNPAKNLVTAGSKTGPFLPEEIRICSVTGKTVARFLPDQPSPGTEMTLDIHGLSPGIYFVEMLTSQGTAILKLMVQ